MLIVSAARLPVVQSGATHKARSESILTWHGLYFDPEGSRSRARPFHCTSVGLTSAITPNAGDSSA